MSRIDFKAYQIYVSPPTNSLIIINHCFAYETQLDLRFETSTQEVNFRWSYE